jgi:predicted amidohydrolase
MPTFSERLFWGRGDGSDLTVYETDIGRIGGLICGENGMTAARLSVISLGEELHIAQYPGAIALHTGPRLQEWDTSGTFFGHILTRAHAVEAGCFVLCACTYLDPADVPDDFPHKGRMNIGYSRGGSQVVAPGGLPIVSPVEGSQMIYANCPASMIKLAKAIGDALGHYGRPDVFRLQINRRGSWVGADTSEVLEEKAVHRDALLGAAERYEIDAALLEQAADDRKILVRD